MIMYSISHFVWFCNSDSILWKKQSLVSLQIAIATDVSPAALVWGLHGELKCFYFAATLEAFSKLSCATHSLAEWPLGRTGSFPFHWQLSHGCCMQGAWISRRVVRVVLWIDATYLGTGAYFLELPKSLSTSPDCACPFGQKSTDAP